MPQCTVHVAFIMLRFIYNTGYFHQSHCIHHQLKCSQDDQINVLIILTEKILKTKHVGPKRLQFTNCVLCECVKYINYYVEKYLFIFAYVWSLHCACMCNCARAKVC